MTDPKRLIDASPDDLTGRILRTALDDQPNEQALHSTAAALGVGGAVVGAALQGSAAGASTQLAGGVKAGVVGVLKWLSVGVATGAVAAGGISAVHHLVARRAAKQSVTRVAAAARARAAAPAHPSLVNLPPQRVGPPPALTAANRSRSLRVHHTAPSTALRAVPTAAFGSAPSSASKSALPPSLAADLALLDRARRALAQHDPRGALQALDVYARQRQSGVLDPEAEVLRIHALLALGEHARAEKLARAFVAAHPTSSYAPELRALYTKTSPE